MGSNPYEAPQADITGGVPPAAGVAEGATRLPPELENRATQLLGAKRSRATGMAFAIAGASCIGVCSLLLGLLLGFIVGGALATVISKAYVRGQTPRYIREVCSELGIPPGAFRPEQYLL